jgi:hypothetical protein
MGEAHDSELLTRVGGRPVGPGLTVLPGVIGAPEPAEACSVMHAGALVRALRLVELAEKGRREHRRVASMEEAELKLRERALEGGPGAPAELEAADELRRAREARHFEASVFVGLMMDARAAGERLADAAGRPLVLVGDHPGLAAELPGLLRAHPQIVHLPDA